MVVFYGYRGYSRLVSNGGGFLRGQHSGLGNGARMRVGGTHQLRCTLAPDQHRHQRSVQGPWILTGGGARDKGRWWRRYLQCSAYREWRWTSALQGAKDDGPAHCKVQRGTAHSTAVGIGMSPNHVPHTHPAPRPPPDHSPPSLVGKQGASARRNKTPTHGGDNTLSRCTYPWQEMGAA
jgi:hypothetical protein